MATDSQKIKMILSTAMVKKIKRKESNRMILVSRFLLAKYRINIVILNVNNFGKN